MKETAPPWRTQAALFWSAHRRTFDLVEDLRWLQECSGNPLTTAEITAALARYPALYWPLRMYQPTFPENADAPLLP